MSQINHFDRIAASYDGYRHPEKTPGVADMLALAMGCAGRRVLEIGCGTGHTLEQLVRDHGVEGVGVEPSREMRRIARGRGLEVVEGVAESLPFAEDTFERAFMQMVVHHLDRPAAFAEVHRVLRPRTSRFAIVTRPPHSILDDWVGRYLPSYPRVASSRFPEVETLIDELWVAGFGGSQLTSVEWTVEITRRDALDALRGRASSNYELLPAGELERGIERIELEMPDTVRYPYVLAILVVDG